MLKSYYSYDFGRWQFDISTIQYSNKLLSTLRAYICYTLY